ncbi:trypsin-like peptidase domain-containing protein [Maritimibacter sp. UBA3975]|uniref:trypsin-like peptidase domain-containing protein n=1 Tax=Maritimibacter sp. UBA3975 TaxID=1946833 RepID=UPI000C0998AD|nr:trypsin-like peptidase domain-containing protein [Maritimibacter sp. UBA3975]MAM63701.1 serine protease [Maritimibacter sp.]|tara:strand:+ start:1572 stop:2951 length:1380 start_codon:yes stop_codon:yes gene_type:complete
MIRVLALCFALVPVAVNAQTQVPDSPAQMQLSFAPVVEETAPAVVNIYASRVVERRNPFADDPFFSQFFRDFDIPPQQQNSLGSGVIVGDGLVVSNYHVVGNATDIRVVLADRREYDGRLVLADEAADLAVIRLDGGEDLPALDFADSDELAVGDLVLAIGNPFGVGQTVSSGIISGLARTGQGGGALLQGGRYFIQTDAPINPGNSGGALVDMRGDLVGINTQIVTRSGGSNGIGFAIPANLVKQVVAQAAAGRDRFERPWSGVEVQVVDASIADAMGLERPMGVLLRDIHPDSPFAQAGLSVGDVVVAIADQPVNAAAELDFRLATHPMGDTVEVRYMNADGFQAARVTLAAAPRGIEAALTAITLPGPFQGLTLSPLSPDIARNLGQPMDAKGVVVVTAEGPARRTGFQRGDVIHSVNHISVTTGDAFEAVIAEGSRWWRVEFSRGGRRITARFNG